MARLPRRGTLLKSVLCAVASIALASGLTACGGSDKPAAAGSVSTSPSVPAPTTAAAPKPAAPSTSSQAALEQAYVLEVMGQMPEMALARAELVKLGHTTCQAFRDKPGSVQFLVDNMKEAGQTKEQIKTAKVVAIASIHNLCTDQVGDL